LGSVNASQSAPAVPADGGRNPGDVTALLVELGRLVKARQFYPQGHPILGDVLDRGFRAFEADLARSGPLELELRQGAFRLAGEPLGRGRVDDLAQDLVTRAVRRLRFDPGLTAEALQHFVATLALEREQVEQAGGFVQQLFASPCPGVTVNEMDYGAALARDGRAGGAGGAGGPDGEEAGDEAGGAEGMAAAGTMGPGEAAGATGGTADADGADAGAAAGIDPAALSEALSGPRQEEKPEPLAPQQQLEQDPLQALSDDDRSAALLAALRELDACEEITRYRDLAGRVAVLAATLADDGLPDEGYRALLVLAAHAGDAARAQPIREFASTSLRELARGARLDDLIDRSCAPGDSVSMRAAQILLRLGEPTVPTLLRRVETEQDLDRRGQLLGILIAMGDLATSELQLSMLSGERRRAGVAIRLAGEMQNAACVPELSALLSQDDVDLRREAAKALVRVGSPDAIETLVAALESPMEGMPGHAAFCLGVAGGDRALEALVRTAARDGNASQVELAREAVRALGRTGRPEAVPVLEEVLGRKRLLGRRRLRELQRAAVTALARLPGDGARAALARAAEHADAEVRDTASQALRRRPGRAEAPGGAAPTEAAG